MDALALLAEAAAAGLEVRRDGERLIVRGPKSAEALAARILDQKAALLAILAPPAGRPRPARPATGPAEGDESGSDGRRPVSAARRAGPGPDGQCLVHGRFLTLREQEAGCCSWCVPDRFAWKEKDRLKLEELNAPRPARAPLPCQGCGGPLPPDRWSLCAPCFDREYPE